MCIYLLISSFSPVARFRWCVVCLGSAYTVAQALNYVRWTCNRDELVEYQLDRPAVWRSMVLKSGKLDRWLRQNYPCHRSDNFCNKKKNNQIDQMFICVAMNFGGVSTTDLV